MWQREPDTFTEKNFADCSFLPREQMPCSQISRRKLLRITTKPQNSWKFSHSKNSRYTVWHYDCVLMCICFKQTFEQQIHYFVIVFLSACGLPQGGAWVSQWPAVRRLCGQPVLLEIPAMEVSGKVRQGFFQLFAPGGGGGGKKEIVCFMGGASTYLCAKHVAN